jgi:hypothetical protein
MAKCPVAILAEILKVPQIHKEDCLYCAPAIDYCLNCSSIECDGCAVKEFQNATN